jgi:hypothetical protein
MAENPFLKSHPATSPPLDTAIGNYTDSAMRRENGFRGRALRQRNSQENHDTPRRKMLGGRGITTVILEKIRARNVLRLVPLAQGGT